MMNQNPNSQLRKQRGITLVELSIAMSLSVFLAGAVVTVQTTATDRFESSLIEHRVNAVSRDAVTTMRQELRSCLFSSIQAVNYVGNEGETVFRFQQAVSFDTANGTTNWGAGDTPGGFIEYAIVGTNLIRRIVAAPGGEPIEESIMIDNIDLDPPKSGIGVPVEFTWDSEGNIVTVMVNRKFQMDGTIVKRQVKTLVYIDPVFHF
ncbi:MAG: type II secretory pathway pseudopilin PulG [Planctomycetota bacterium]